MSDRYTEEPKVEAEATEGEEGYVYKKVLPNKQNRRTWSLASLVLAILSLLLVYFSWISLILGIGAVACALISRKNLGYFDKMTLAGIIIAIFGLVFAVAGLIFIELLLGLLFS